MGWAPALSWSGERGQGSLGKTQQEDIGSWPVVQKQVVIGVRS